MKIGIFDSGIGGLSVLHQAADILRNQEFIYYADEAHVPYGQRSASEILSFTRHAIQFMLSHGADAVVIACNTATSAAAETLRQEFDIPIIGMEPAVREAMRFCGGKRILVSATPVTLNGAKFQRLTQLVDYNHLTDSLPLGELVSFAEREEFSSDDVRSYLAKRLSPFTPSDYGALVLGCTHFNYFKDSFRAILGDDIHIVDGNTGTVRQLMRLLSLEPCTTGTAETSFYFSDSPVTEDERARICRYLSRLDDMRTI